MRAARGHAFLPNLCSLTLNDATLAPRCCSIGGPLSDEASAKQAEVDAVDDRIKDLLQEKEEKLKELNVELGKSKCMVCLEPVSSESPYADDPRIIGRPIPAFLTLCSNNHYAHSACFRTMTTHNFDEGLWRAPKCWECNESLSPEKLRELQIGDLGASLPITFDADAIAAVANVPAASSSAQGVDQRLAGLREMQTALENQRRELLKHKREMRQQERDAAFILKEERKREKEARKLEQQRLEEQRRLQRQAEEPERRRKRAAAQVRAEINQRGQKRKLDVMQSQAEAFETFKTPEIVALFTKHIDEINKDIVTYLQDAANDEEAWSNYRDMQTNDSQLSKPNLPSLTSFIIKRFNRIKASALEVKKLVERLIALARNRPENNDEQQKKFDRKRNNLFVQLIREMTNMAADADMVEYLRLGKSKNVSDYRDPIPTYPYELATDDITGLPVEESVSEIATSYVHWITWKVRDAMEDFERLIHKNVDIDARFRLRGGRATNKDYATYERTWFERYLLGVELTYKYSWKAWFKVFKTLKEEKGETGETAELRKAPLMYLKQNPGLEEEIYSQMLGEAIRRQR